MGGAPFGWHLISCAETSREHPVESGTPPAHAPKPQSRGRPVTSRSVEVVNQLGVHARAAAKFVHVASRFEARVRVTRSGREIDGKSILGILLLAAARGTTILISADGADEQAALEALSALVESGFGESA
jgi:phosphocarrier protein HPr